MLRKIAALLSPADKASEKAEQIAMTTPERREKCWQNQVANQHFRPLQYLLDAKPPPFRRRWQPVDQCRPTPCRGTPFNPRAELESESQNENPGLYLNDLKM
jgi:hypothetical protein